MSSHVIYLAELLIIIITVVVVTIIIIIICTIYGAFKSISIKHKDYRKNKQTKQYTATTNTIQIQQTRHINAAQVNSTVQSYSKQ